MLTEKTYDTGQVTLRYMEGLNKGKPLVMLHGQTGYWRSFSEIIPHFEANWHVYAVDLRGHGASSRAGDAYRLLNYATDIINFVRDVSGEGTVLWGQGLGAKVALTSAVTLDVVSALILEDLRIETNAPSASAPAQSNEGTNRFTENLITLIRRELPAHLMENALRDLRFETLDGKTVRFGDTRKGDHMRVTAEGLSMADANTLVVNLSEILPDGYTPSRLLDRARCPILYLCGDLEQGGMVSNADFEKIKGFIKRGVIKRIPGGGHNLHRTRPDAVVTEVKRFLEDFV